MGFTFGEFLKQKRLEKNLTQKELAKMLYISESSVSKWEKDIAYPDITLLPKLSEILGVTEHEIITASVDKQTREEKIQAKKWRTFSFSWSLFFYISYAITILTCFICDLAINKTLSWFWIVLSALLLAFTFTNLPKLLKRHKLILLPLVNFLSLCILLAVCCIYTKGNWFWISSLSILLGYVIIFVPIYISKYKLFSKVKSFGDFVSLFVDFVVLNILLIVIDFYCVTNNYSSSHWFLSIAFPIVLGSYLILNLFLSVRFLKLNRFIKTSVVLFMINVLYIISMFIRVDNVSVQYELDSLNIFKANFSNWTSEMYLERNIHCIIFLTILLLAVVFLISGLIKHFKRENKG